MLKESRFWALLLSNKGGKSIKADFIEREHFSLLLELMRPDNALALRVALVTGLRIGDVLALTPECLGSDNIVRTICAKTDKPFEGRVPSHIAIELWQNANDFWLFPSPTDRERHKTRQAVWADLKKAVKKCGVRLNVTPHSARKIYAVETFHRKGLDAVQERLGHDRIETSMLYAFADFVTNGVEHRSTDAERLPDEKAATFVAAFVDELGGREQVFAAAVRAMKKAGQI